MWTARCGTGAWLVGVAVAEGALVMAVVQRGHWWRALEGVCVVVVVVGAGTVCAGVRRPLGRVGVVGVVWERQLVMAMVGTAGVGVQLEVMVVLWRAVGAVVLRGAVMGVGVQNRKVGVPGVKGLEVGLGPDPGPCHGHGRLVEQGRLEPGVANAEGLLGRG